MLPELSRASRPLATYAALSDAPSTRCFDYPSQYSAAAQVATDVFVGSPRVLGVWDNINMRQHATKINRLHSTALTAPSRGVQDNSPVADKPPTGVALRSPHGPVAHGGASESTQRGGARHGDRRPTLSERFKCCTCHGTRGATHLRCRSLEEA